MNNINLLNWILDFSNYKRKGLLIAEENVEAFKELGEQYGWNLSIDVQLISDQTESVDVFYVSKIELFKLHFNKPLNQIFHVCVVPVCT